MKKQKAKRKKKKIERWVLVHRTTSEPYGTFETYGTFVTIQEARRMRRRAVYPAAWRIVKLEGWV